MIAVALSLVFGVIAFAAIFQVVSSVRRGVALGRLIVAELGRIDHASQTVVRFADRRPVAAVGQPLLAAA